MAFCPSIFVFAASWVTWCLQAHLYAHISCFVSLTCPCTLTHRTVLYKTDTCKQIINKFPHIIHTQTHTLCRDIPLRNAQHFLPVWPLSLSDRTSPIQTLNHWTTVSVCVCVCVCVCVSAEGFVMSVLDRNRWVSVLHLYFLRIHIQNSTIELLPYTVYHGNVNV